MRYIVSEGAIGPNGRTVRCAHCGNQWFEQAEEGLDEALFSHDEREGVSLYAARDLDDFDDKPLSYAEETTFPDMDFQSILQKEIESAPIPDGVKPIHEEYDPVLAQLGPQKEVKLPSGAKFSGFLTAALIWVFILGGLLFAQPHISRLFPASNMIYSLIGLKPVMPGEGLALDGLRAEIADGKISLQGSVINLRDTDLKVPSIMATIVDQDEKPIEQLLIAPPVAQIKAEGQASFDAIYPNVPDGASNVTFAFSFMDAGHAMPEKEEAPAPEVVGETHDTPSATQDHH
jgi:predicted Zn finger-like uncharacterized protein